MFEHLFAIFSDRYALMCYRAVTGASGIGEALLAFGEGHGSRRRRGSSRRHFKHCVAPASMRWRG
jgi:hypothetical protein